MSHLHVLPSVTTTPKKRLGRGYGSGKGGHNSSRGTKGQRSRNGGQIPQWFEGGQLPLIKRLPMWRGKHRLNAYERVAHVSLAILVSLPTSDISLETLKLYKKIPKRSTACRVTANGSITQPITVTGLRVSKAAQEKITAAGGTIQEG